MLEAEGKTFGRDHVAHKCLGLYQKLGWEKVVLIGAFKLMLASGPKELDPSPVWEGENMGSSRWTRTKLAGHESRRVFGWWVSHVRSTDWAGTWALLGRGRPWEMVHRAGICGGHGGGPGMLGTWRTEYVAAMFCAWGSGELGQGWGALVHCLPHPHCCFELCWGLGESPPGPVPCLR